MIAIAARPLRPRAARFADLREACRAAAHAQCVGAEACAAEPRREMLITRARAGSPRRARGARTRAPSVVFRVPAGGDKLTPNGKKMARSCAFQLDMAVGAR